MQKLSKHSRHPVSVVINGNKVAGYAEPRMLLSDFLVHELGMTGTHVGCEHGVCGACVVRIDGRPAHACLTLAVQVDGREVDTVEGLADADGELSELQQAFQRHHALQCGYCTPGILMALGAYLETNPNPSEQELRDMLSGHLCRCTGYVGIVRAVMDYVSRRTNASI